MITFVDNAHPLERAYHKTGLMRFDARNRWEFGHLIFRPYWNKKKALLVNLVFRRRATADSLLAALFAAGFQCAVMLAPTRKQQAWLEKSGAKFEPVGGQWILKPMPK